MSTVLPGLIRVDKSKRKLAAEVLARAFDDYPDLTYYFPNERARKAVSLNLLTMEVASNMRYGEVLATPKLEGVALWIKSQNYPVSSWRFFRAVPWSAIIAFAMHGGNRLKFSGEFMNAVHRRLAPFPHWYLETIGVEPSFQGMGYASRLIRPFLDKTDQEELPCYLETSKEKNVSLYEHFGFRVLEKSTIPGTTLTNWAMLRDVHGVN